MNRSSIVAVLILVTALACGGADEATDNLPPEGADAAATEDAFSLDGASDSSRAAVLDPGPSSDPFTGFELEADPAEAVERRIALLLRNHDVRTALVYANGGAGEVLLDTVPPGSDVRVDILSRAATIALRSVAPDGELLREAQVSPGPDTIVDVIVGSAPAGP